MFTILEAIVLQLEAAPVRSRGTSVAVSVERGLALSELCRSSWAKCPARRGFFNMVSGTLVSPNVEFFVQVNVVEGTARSGPTFLCKKEAAHHEASTGKTPHLHFTVCDVHGPIRSHCAGCPRVVQTNFGRVLWQLHGDERCGHRAKIVNKFTRRHPTYGFFCFFCALSSIAAIKPCFFLVYCRGMMPSKLCVGRSHCHECKQTSAEGKCSVCAGVHDKPCEPSVA